jgi:hypothetical protein
MTGLLEDGHHGRSRQASECPHSLAPNLHVRVMQRFTQSHHSSLSPHESQHPDGFLTLETAGARTVGPCPHSDFVCSGRPNECALWV